MHLLLALSFLITPADTDTVKLDEILAKYFQEYRVANYRPHSMMALDSFRVDESARALRLYPNESFCAQSFTPELVERLRNTIGETVKSFYKGWDITLYDQKGREIAELIPNIRRKSGRDKARLWPELADKITPWVSRADRPFKITEGLEGRHLFIWPSHGRVYRYGEWQWQRPNLYCTNEDLFTQSIVLPYLFPMLENAGAIVYSPRERDYQSQEAVVDNDTPTRHGSYEEKDAAEEHWITSERAGFAPLMGLMNDSIHPFRDGTYRKIRTTKQNKELSTATWRANIPEAGEYAVYVSYGKEEEAVPDAHYTVYHKDGHSEFRVNQRMGAETWVYLGTFDFDKGVNANSRVVLTNESDYRGTVSADAVRFGGGTGQTERGDVGTSGLPRYAEAARYQAAWAGMPDETIYTTQPANDYTDDLRVRGGMLNYLTGGSPYIPDAPGGHVPFCFALAVHSDAGVRRDHGVYGSLSISTARGNNGENVYPGHTDRKASFDLATLILDNLTDDLSRALGITWPRREHWDRNYAETRIPDVPSAIIETLSHQNFGDLIYGHDPLFKFTLARSLYATIVSYVNFQHGHDNYTIQPLPVKDFSAILVPDGGGAAVRLSWKPETDTLYHSRPEGYIVYTRKAGGTFDNGRYIKGEKITVPITTGIRYDFRVTAVNKGGESFPSETLSARYAGPGKRCALLVNAFTRLSGPARIVTPDSVGFDIKADIGLPYLRSTAFTGKQINFNANLMGTDGAEACGLSGNELAGRVIAGNTFNYPAIHGDAIARVSDISYCSTSVSAFIDPDFSTKDYALIDYIAGAQARRPYNLRPYPVFPKGAAKKLEDYLTASHGCLILSGSYLVSDGIKEKEGRHLLEETLQTGLDGSASPDSLGSLKLIDTAGTAISLFDSPNDENYAATSPDILRTGFKKNTPFTYFDNHAASLIVKDKRFHAALLAIPLECIQSDEDRVRILNTLLR